MVHSDLNGRYAVITGGTQGLGEAVARLFSERGAAGIVICGRNEVRGNKVASELTAGGCPTYFVQADLASVEDCRRVADRADSSFGKVHALVNCAAMTDRGTILDTSQELFDRIFAVNVRAPFFLMQESAKVMRREGIAGTMVNILSVTSHGGSSFLCPYSSSKGALSTLTKNVAFSLLRDRIRVNGLNLGWMDTPGEHAIRTTKYHDAPPDWLETGCGGVETTFWAADQSRRSGTRGCVPEFGGVVVPSRLIMDMVEWIAMASAGHIGKGEMVKSAPATASRHIGRSAWNVRAFATGNPSATKKWPPSGRPDHRMRSGSQKLFWG